MARVRLWGDLSPEGRDALTVRWYNSMPAVQATAVLSGFAGLSTADARAVAKVRPVLRADDLPAELRAALAR
jgi:allantoicase